MKIKSFFAAVVIAASSVSPALAATYGIGDVTGGFSGNYVLAADPDNNGEKVDFFNFTLNTAPGFAVTNIEITVQSVAGSNLFPVFGLGDSSGDLLGATPNTNGGNANDEIPIVLSLSGTPVFADGTYTIAVAAWKANITDPIGNSTSGAFFNNGSYSLDIDPTISAVPLPAGGLLLMTGMGALAFSRRKKRKS